MPGQEDIEWAKYWMERGFKVVYEPDAGIYHIRFVQHYESTAIKDLGWKELYVRREGTQLRILSETWRELEKDFQPLQPNPSFLMAFKEFGSPSM